ncbi:LOW QUALITY PROTEIN: adiponectin receptor protein 1-like [Lepidochelys kempii]|uniref:LOW QUALITY PROTEIN: adiponectin receptor protein 1-like n=2 Tax=Cheloniidae TaxID=8465 RepID=UPI003C702F54
MWGVTWEADRRDHEAGRQENLNWAVGLGGRQQQRLGPSPGSPFLLWRPHRGGPICGGPEALAEMGPLLGEDTSQQGAEVGAEPAGWGAAVQWGAEEPDDADPMRVLTLPLQAQQAMGRMEEFVFKVWEGRWRVFPHDVLPDWLKDNDFLLHGHRPPMPSFRACFRSIFRLHTETGNIWTHLIGALFFLVLGIGYMFSPNMNYRAPVQERVVFGTFFLGATLCLCFSCLFHTVYCHSERVSRTFSKLDYSGITLLIVGSFVPWLYYSFYCSPQPQLIYLIIVCALGVTAITVSQWDHFATPQYRAVRAGVFLGLGLSGLVPTLHFMLAEGPVRAVTAGQMGWLFLMALLYILGAVVYAARVPERFFPGKCDIWFHSHQIFHVLVVAGAGVHLHGVSQLQAFRSSLGGTCTKSTVL